MALLVHFVTMLHVMWVKKAFLEVLVTPFVVLKIFALGPGTCNTKLTTFYTLVYSG